MTVKLLDYETPKTADAQLDLDVLVLAGADRVCAGLDRILAGIEHVNHALVSSASSQPLQDDAVTLFANVVILDVATVNEAILEDIRRFTQERFNTTELFVTLLNPDTQAVKLLLQAGVADIVGQPFDREEIARALGAARDRLQRAERKASPARNAVSAFMRTHPAAGGSFLASNIAWQLASEFGKDTVLVDMDIQFGTVASELDVKPNSGLLEALRNPERIDKVFLDVLMTRHPSGLKILASPGDLSPSELLNRKAVTRLIAVLAESHERVVINLPLLMNEAVEQVLRHANPVFLVTHGGMSALRNLRMILDHLQRHEIAENQVEIVHMDGPARDEKANTELLKKLAGASPIHSVQQDQKLLFRADNEGRAASELYPRADLVKDIRNIATRLSGNQPTDTALRKNGLLRWFN
ncbi:MAG: hypothetical protein RLZZ227_652 [Pseudomonadota bacterium]|jgi:pilus assembly protein CpaE